jgi:hypothetical protein
MSVQETNRGKFYVAKYFFLALAMLQVFVGLLLQFRLREAQKDSFIVFAFFGLSLIFFALFFLFSSKLKRVAISKKKIAILYPNKTKSYRWDEVKELKFFSMVGVYRVKLKKRKHIYFLPSNNREALYGLFSAKPDVLSKKISKG